MPSPIYDSFQIKNNNSCANNSDLKTSSCNSFSTLDRKQTFRTATLGNLGYIVVNDNQTQCLQKDNSMGNITSAQCQVFNPYTVNPGFQPFHTTFSIPRDSRDPKAFQPYDSRKEAQLARDYTPDGKVDYSKIVNKPLINKVEYKDLSTTPFLTQGNVAIGSLL